MMVFDWQVNNYRDKDNLDMTIFFRNNFTYSFMLVLCLQFTGFSLVGLNSSYSVVVVWGLSLWWLLLLWSRGSRAFNPASGVAACGLSSCCSWALEYRLNSCGAWA